MAEPTAHTEAPGGHGGGFPPFDAHSFPSQIVWLVVSFVLLYALMAKIALPRIGAIFAERSRVIGDDLKAAEDLERVRLLFDDLETKRGVADLLGRAEQAEGARIFIGSENKLFSLSGSSTIVAPYRDGAGRIIGVIGVIGPTRLNYARVIPTVDYAARIVSRMLGG